MWVLGCSTESGLLGVAAGGDDMYSPTAILSARLMLSETLSDDARGRQ